jgi:hypothetical protein
MKWLREHRKSNHPTAFRRSIEKGVATRKSKKAKRLLRKAWKKGMLAKGKNPRLGLIL